MKIMNAVKKYGPGVAGFTLLPLGSAMAQTDYDAITAVANWQAVATGVITIFAALALVLVALKGGRKLLSAIGR